MNMLLHDIPDADLRNNDDGTLEDPAHITGGELQRFDRISRHVTPFNERDQSWLRTTIGETRGLELHHFLNLLASTSIGQASHAKWLEWVAECRCTWDLASEGNMDEAHWPTAQTHDGVDPSCQMMESSLTMYIALSVTLTVTYSGIRFRMGAVFPVARMFVSLLYLAILLCGIMQHLRGSLSNAVIYTKFEPIERSRK